MPRDLGLDRREPSCAREAHESAPRASAPSTPRRTGTCGSRHPNRALAGAEPPVVLAVTAGFGWTLPAGCAAAATETLGERRCNRGRACRLVCRLRHLLSLLGGVVAADPRGALAERHPSGHAILPDRQARQATDAPRAASSAVRSTACCAHCPSQSTASTGRSSSSLRSWSAVTCSSRPTPASRSRRRPSTRHGSPCPAATGTSTSSTGSPSTHSCRTRRATPRFPGERRCRLRKTTGRGRRA